MNKINTIDTIDVLKVIMLYYIYIAYKLYNFNIELSSLYLFYSIVLYTQVGANSAHIIGYDLD